MVGNEGVACEEGFFTFVYTLTSVSLYSLPHNVVCHAGLQSVELPAGKLSDGRGRYEGKLYFFPHP